MIKKILLIFITVFALSNVNAQNIVSSSPGCGNVNEFENNGLVNGKNSYLRTTTITALGAIYGAVTGNNTVGIQYTGTQWVFYRNSNPTDILFSNSFAGAGIEAPNTGWVGSGAVCTLDSGVVLTLFDNGGGILDVPKESLENSKINIYPNPSSNFISISNLKEAVQCKITNITGQTVLSKVVDTNNNQMDISGLSKGFYFVEIAGKKTIKLIKK